MLSEKWKLYNKQHRPSFLPPDSCISDYGESNIAFSESLLLHVACVPRDYYVPISI